MHESIIRTACTLLLALPAVACGQGGIGNTAEAIEAQTVVDGLEHPWGLVFLPDGRMLVTERPGRLRLVEPDGTLSEALGGVPEVFAQGQGGLLDVALDPEFPHNGLVYLSFAEAGPEGASTAVARGRLDGNALREVEVIFRQEPKVDGNNHFGSRLVFDPDGNLLVALGERFKFDPAQELSNHLGTVVRIRPDGAVPADNPFVGREGARPEIWSYGHRNIQAAAIHPQTGALWVAEHGPRGGDELNIVQAGGNYGWPLVSWGRHYDGRDIPDPPSRPDLIAPVHHWTPAIAPSGMTFYTGGLIGAWQGDLLVGALVARAIVRLREDGEGVSEVGRLELGARIRAVVQGPDGAVYTLTDAPDGAILRLGPADGDGPRGAGR